jgi:regulatory protein
MVAARVTEIRPTAGPGSRLTVFIDGAEAFTVSEEVAGELGLAVGVEIGADDAEPLRTDDGRQKAREAALRLLSVRARSEGELADRLARKGFDVDVVGEVIEALRQVGLVDDEAFARAWADERARLRPVGPRRLAGELMEKRIDRQTAERVVDETFAACPEIELARRAAAAKGRPGRGGTATREEVAKRRRRLFSFLVRRGFSYEVANTVARETEGEADA